MSVNKIILIGHMGKDPETRMAGAAKVATFSLATSETYKDKAGEKITNTEWHNCEAWGPLAGIIEKFVKKGDKLFLEGKITYQTYEKDGQKHNVTKIRISQMVMLSGSVGHAKNPPVQSTSEFDDVQDLPF